MGYTRDYIERCASELHDSQRGNMAIAFAILEHAKAVEHGTNQIADALNALVDAIDSLSKEQQTLRGFIPQG